MSAQLLLAELSILPVVTVHQPEDAVAIATALSEAGINAIEVTLRTPAAIEAIQAIRDALPDCLIGAGTVLTPEQFTEVKAAGAQFALSPGTTLTLIEAAADAEMPFIPGVITPSEIMAAAELGCDVLKVFPANFYGNAKGLANILKLFPDRVFCPTGGINENNLNDFLAIDNIACVGGSWLTPADLVDQKDWNGITQLAKAALAKIQ